MGGSPTGRALGSFARAFGAVGRRVGITRVAWLGVAAAFVLRLAYLLAVKVHQTLLINDSFYYSAQATQLARGRLFQDLAGDPAAEHGPLTAVLLAPFSWMGSPVNWQRFGNVIVGTATVVALAALATRVHSRSAGSVCAWVAAVSPNLFINDTLIMSEPAAILCVASSLIVLRRVAADGRRRDVALTGVLIGASALARSELLLLAPLSALALTAAGRGRWAAVQSAAAITMVALLTVAPWSLYNAGRFDKPVALTTNDGTTLLAANCPGSYYGEMLGSADLSCVLAAPIDGDPSVRSAAQRSLARSYATEHLGRVPVVVAARLGRLLDLYAVRHSIEIEQADERSARVAWLGVGAWWVMVPLAVVGLRAVARRDRWLLALPMLSTLAVAVAVYGGHRPRAALEGVLAIAASIGLVSAAARRRAMPARGRRDAGVLR